MKELEASYQKRIIELAQWNGWLVAHFRRVFDANAKRWMTPVAADGKGFPDLVLVRDRTMLFVELKAKGGRTSADQKIWQAAIRGVPGVFHMVCYPHDEEHLREFLSRKRDRIDPPSKKEGE